MRGPCPGCTRKRTPAPSWWRRGEGASRGSDLDGGGARVWRHAPLQVERARGVVLRVGVRPVVGRTWHQASCSTPEKVHVSSVHICSGLQCHVPRARTPKMRARVCVRVWVGSGEEATVGGERGEILPRSSPAAILAKHATFAGFAPLKKPKWVSKPRYVGVWCQLGIPRCLRHRADRN